MIFFICGNKGSGKTYLANQLQRANKFQIKDTGPILRKIYISQKEKNSFGEWIKNNELIFGDNFSNIAICENISIEANKNYTIVGNRSIEGIKYTINYFNIKDFRIIFIDGDHDLFFQNYNNREKSKIEAKEYKELLNIESNMGIERLKQYIKENPKEGKVYYKTKNDNSILIDIQRRYIKDFDKGDLEL